MKPVNFHMKIKRMIYLGISVLLVFSAMCMVSVSFSNMNNDNHPKTINCNVNTFEEVPYYED